ncbi:hypothetical protein [Paracidovorax anthurii]|uniref:Uncharacterized protein n=1 Tax=Paracidovorax anthurii TaxID=78229 RepID=A0A328Z8Q2_9BURK|nr:hypothetical protein [Paracidovorax anthurii]RAR78636.1 hypothetical protein AX018_102911 [Paracidovorax anthurii]
MTDGPAPGAPPDAGGAVPAALESAAYPPLVRALAVVIVAGLAAFALRSLPELRGAHWPFASLATFALAAVLIGWVGWWMVFSRTRLLAADGTLVQTWLWDKHVRAADVASFKIVHWPGLSAVIAPRILLRRRGGGITWVHSADPALLTGFAECVVRQGIDGQRGTSGESAAR